MGGIRISRCHHASVGSPRRRRQRQYDRPPRIAFDNQISARYTVVDIEAQDTVGLLYRIAYLLDELDLNIYRAIFCITASNTLSFDVNNRSIP